MTIRIWLPQPTFRLRPSPLHCYCRAAAFVSTAVTWIWAVPISTLVRRTVLLSQKKKKTTKAQTTLNPSRYKDTSKLTCSSKAARLPQWALGLGPSLIWAALRPNDSLGMLKIPAVDHPSLPVVVAQLTVTAMTLQYLLIEPVVNGIACPATTETWFRRDPTSTKV